MAKLSRSLAKLEAEKSKRKGVKKKPGAAIVVADAVSKGAELFHTPGKDPFGTFTVDGHLETYPIRSRFVHMLLRYECWRRKQPATRQVIGEAVDNLEARAIFEGPEDEVYLRVAEYDGAIYLDLCDTEWRQIEVASKGWSVLSTEESPVRFRRAAGMLPLPEPERGGSIDDLRGVINITDADWPLFLC